MNQKPIDPTRLAWLVKSQIGPLCSYARRWVENPEDCVQEAFIALAAEIPVPENPTAWLYLVTKRKAINQVRQATRRRQRETKSAWPQENEMGADQPAVAKDEQEKLNRLVSRLPEPHKEIVQLRIWGKLTWAEIQNQTNVSTSTAQRHYITALGLLKQQLESPCPTKKNSTQD